MVSVDSAFGGAHGEELPYRCFVDVGIGIVIFVVETNHILVNFPLEVIHLRTILVYVEVYTRCRAVADKVAELVGKVEVYPLVDGLQSQLGFAKFGGFYVHVSVFRKEFVVFEDVVFGVEVGFFVVKQSASGGSFFSYYKTAFQFNFFAVQV